MSRGERDSHCSAHPLSRRAAGAPHWHYGRTSLPSGARAVPHSPRAGGATRNQTRTHAVVAQRNESTWLRTRGSGVRISPTALAAVDRRSNSESTSTADSERGNGRIRSAEIHSSGRVVAQLGRAGEVPRRFLVRASGRRIEGSRISRSRVRVSPALPVPLGAHGRWPRATGSVAQQRSTEHGVAAPRPMVRRGRGGAETRRRDAGANPAGPGSLVSW